MFQGNCSKFIMMPKGAIAHERHEAFKANRKYFLRRRTCYDDKEIMGVMCGTGGRE